MAFLMILCMIAPHFDILILPQNHEGFNNQETENRQGINALTVCYMFQSTFVLPSSLITILCIIIIATAFFRS